MIRRLVLENFMAHRHTEIELGEGLTVLMGPNNCGKSAVVEALLTVCRNLPGEVVVRHGEKTCRVSVETDDGHTVTWQRKAGQVSYDVDGKPFHRLGGSVPEDARRILRLEEVQTTLDRFEVHFGVQKAPLFLLGYSESRIAAFFSSSSDAERLMQMQGRHREKVRNAKQRHKETAGEVEKLDRQLAALAPLEVIASVMDAAEREFSAIRTAQQDYEEASDLTDELLAAVFRAQWLGAELGAMQPLAPPPQLEDAQPLEKLLEQIEAEARVVRREGARAHIAKPLSPPPRMEETALLERLVADLQLASRQSAHAGRRVSAVNPLASPPVLEDERPLVELGKRLKRASDDQQLARKQYAAAERLRAAPLVEDCRPMEELLQKCDEQKKSAARIAVDIVELSRTMSEVAQQIRDWARENPVCPVCGGQVSAQAILAQEHGHG